MWHVSSRSGVATLRTAIQLLLGQPMEPALWKLYRHTFVPYSYSWCERTATALLHICSLLACSNRRIIDARWWCCRVDVDDSCNRLRANWADTDTPCWSGAKLTAARWGVCWRDGSGAHAICMYCCSTLLSHSLHRLINALPNTTTGHLPPPRSQSWRIKRRLRWEGFAETEEWKTGGVMDDESSESMEPAGDKSPTYVLTTTSSHHRRRISAVHHYHHQQQQQQHASFTRRESAPARRPTTTEAVNSTSTILGRVSRNALGRSSERIGSGMSTDIQSPDIHSPCELALPDIAPVR